MPFVKGQVANPKGSWKKGQSGNPNGRPRKETFVGDFLKQRLKAHELRGKKMPNGMTVGEAIAEQIIVNAFNGDTACIKEIMNRFAPIIEYSEIEITGVSPLDEKEKYTIDEIKSIAEVLKDAGFNAQHDHRGPLADVQSAQAPHETGGVPAGGEEPESA